MSAPVSSIPLKLVKSSGVKIPVWVIADKVASASSVADEFMRFGGDLVDMERLDALPAVQEESRAWVSSEEIHIRLGPDRGDHFSFFGSTNEPIDAAWMDLCRDAGGLLVLFSNVPIPDEIPGDYYAGLLLGVSVPVDFA